MQHKHILMLTIALSIILTGMNTLQGFANNGFNDSSSDLETISIVSVDAILRNPSKYKGLIAVGGRVAKVDESNSMFSLGCDDICLILPVKYSGKMPGENSDITVYGEVKKNRGAGLYF